MQPCGVCGNWGIDGAGYCTNCRTLRGMPPATRSRGLMVVTVVAVCVAVVAVLASIVVVEVATKSDPRALPSAVSHAQPSSQSASASASPEISPSSSLVDPCVVGTWTETSHEIDGQVNGVKVRFSGKGVIQKFRPDGTLLLDYTGVILTGTSNGVAYEWNYAGTLNYNYQTSNGFILLSNPAGTGTATFKVDGSVQSTRPMQGTIAPERYTCAGDVIREYTDIYAIEASRISRST
jgi:hypothetical protein